MLNKKSVDDINVKGKRVLCRCDFNVPLKEGKITDENRLVAALPTIKKLIADGGKVILCSHLGKPKGEPKPELSLAPVAARMTELLGQEVKFAADAEVVGPNAKAAVEAMKDGDVVLLENTRYRKEETKNGEEFSKDLASLCFIGSLLWLFRLQLKHISFNKRVLFGLFGGIIFGLVIRLLFEKVSNFSTSLSWISLVADAYVALLQMLVMPLVFISIVGAFTKLEVSKNLGKMARNVLAILLGTTAISAAVGYLSAIAFGLNG